MTAAASLAGLLLLTACTSGGEGPDGANDALERIRETETQSGERISATIPSDLQMIPDDYRVPANQQGRLERLTYTTSESFSYEDRSQELAKTAWVYVPYGYTDEQPYNVLYLSHGGWSNEKTIMGTDTNPTTFKNVVDHGIEDGLVEPLIIVPPTYNNTSPEDSGDYGLALRLTDNFHNELVNDLIPAAESTYSTYAEDVSVEAIEASRDHRGFGGLSMGSVNTWRTFEHALPYFRYFMPMSGSLSSDGELLEGTIEDSGYTSDDFFIFAMTGTDDFAYPGFKNQIDAMAGSANGVFVEADSEAEGNLAHREREGYRHDGAASDEYTYNGLRFFWNPRVR